MKDERVAKRYAAALFGLACRETIVDAVSADLLFIERLLVDLPSLRAALMHPLASEQSKLKIVENAFGDRVTARSLSFLNLLVRKQRENLIDECIKGFRALVAETENTVEAMATTAVQMTAKQQESLQRALEQRTGKRIHLMTTVAAEMLGGVVVRLEDTVIDGSVRGRLHRLEQQLLGKRLPGDSVIGRKDSGD